MNKSVFCSQCGTELPITRKAMPKFSRIIDLVPPHECPEEPLSIDLTSNQAPKFIQEPKGKFVQVLNNLKPSLSTEELRDRRDIVGEVKSTAPLSILKGIGSLNHTIPEHDSDEEPSE
jgi:hypothetical protein